MLAVTEGNLCSTGHPITGLRLSWDCHLVGIVLVAVLSAILQPSLELLDPTIYRESSYCYLNLVHPSE